MRAGEDVRTDGDPVSPERRVMGIGNVKEEETLQLDAEDEGVRVDIEGEALRTKEEVTFRPEEAVRKTVVEDKRVVKKMFDPRKPTVEEVTEHELTHIPYRNWCPICVKSKGKDLDHRKSVEEERGVSEYALDYIAFPVTNSASNSWCWPGAKRSRACISRRRCPPKAPSEGSRWTKSSTTWRSSATVRPGSS